MPPRVGWGLAKTGRPLGNEGSQHLSSECSRCARQPSARGGAWGGSQGGGAEVVELVPEER